MSIKLSHSNELDKILTDKGKEKLVIVDYFAVWCGPCMAIAPKLDEIATQQENVMVLKVDVENPELEELVRRANITAMPTFEAYVNGALVDTWKGANINRVNTLVEKWAK